MVVPSSGVSLGVSRGCVAGLMFEENRESVDLYAH